MLAQHFPQGIPTEVRSQACPLRQVEVGKVLVTTVGSRFADKDNESTDAADAGEAAEPAAEGESGDEEDGSSAALALVRAPLA